MHFEVSLGGKLLCATGPRAAKRPYVEVFDSNVFLQVKVLHEFLIATVVDARELFRLVVLLAYVS